jgi:hypothetical protein
MSVDLVAMVPAQIVWIGSLTRVLRQYWGEDTKVLKLSGSRGRIKEAPTEVLKRTLNSLSLFRVVLGGDFANRKRWHVDRF